jgi:hypothetical protein
MKKKRSYMMWPAKKRNWRVTSLTHSSWNNYLAGLRHAKLGYGKVEVGAQRASMVQLCVAKFHRDTSA